MSCVDDETFLENATVPAMALVLVVEDEGILAQTI